MDIKAFMEEMADILDLDPEAVSEITPLDKENWDSLAVVSTIALIDEQCGLTVPGEQLAGCKRIGDILKIVQPQADA